MGKRSLLFGCHQIFIHPLFTIIGWVKLYGIGTINIPILLAIFFHDWGYWSCKTMDGDGLFHPFRTFVLFNGILPPKSLQEIIGHSRHLSSSYGIPISRLCWADKLGLAVMPSSLWALLAYISSEGWEYMYNPFNNNYVLGEDETLLGLIKFHKKIKIAMNNLIRKEAHIV